MKNVIICFAFAIVSAMSFGDTITNTVVIVSNYYNNVYHESVVTQKVKNTHVEYYFTNNVYTVSNRTIVVSQTNLNVNVINTNFGPWIAKCEAAANNASNALSAATSAASASAESASSANSRASAAAASAQQAAASAQQAQSAANTGLANINARIQWFDDHSGETITQVTVTTNITMVLDNTYSYLYSTPQGTKYQNIRIYPYVVSGSRCVISPNSSQYASVTLKAWTSSSSSTASTKSWTFVPSYVDSDVSGLRLQYVVDSESMSKVVHYYDDNNGNLTVFNDEYLRPEYFYWQNGTFYFKLNSWKNGSVVRYCIVKYVFSTFPNTINYGSGSGVLMTAVKRYNFRYWVRNSAFTAGNFYIQTATRTDAVADKVNFPDSMSPADMAAFNWMKYGP